MVKKEMKLYLSKSLTTKAIVIKLLLKQSDKREAIAIVTDSDYINFITTKKISYGLFATAKNKNIFKKYITDILEEYQQPVNNNDIDSLINDLETKIEQDIQAEETLKNIANENFKDKYNYYLNLLEPEEKTPTENIIDNDTNILTLCELFITENYKTELYNLINNSNINDDFKTLVIDYELLNLKYPYIIDVLEDNPEEVITSFNKAITNIRLDNEEVIIKTRLKNIDNKLKLREVKKSKRIGQLVEVEATVKQTEDVRPSLDMAVFSCNNCLKLYEIQQNGELVAPSVCECGGHDFKLIDSESTYIDTQNLIIQEPLEETKGQPKTLKLKLNEDLVDTIIAGNTAKVTGILKTTKLDKNKQDFILEANNIQSLDTDLEDIIITPEEEEEIKRISKRNDVIQYLANSIAPNVKGYSEIKKGLLCSIAGAGETYKKRNMIHVLIIGDPGIAKTQIIRGLEDITIKSITTDGAGASGKGLTAVTSQDSNGNWTIEAGALPLANNGYVFIDEIDKLARDKQSELDSALESGTIYVNRAGISTVLKANTTVLAFGNPKNRRFNNYAKTPAEQLNINEELKSRFDLIYAIADKPNEDKDTKIANAIINSYVKEDEKDKENIVNTELLTKYIIYAKRNYKPTLNKKHMKVLTKHYVTSRNKDYDEADGILSYEARDLDSIIRISGALAKVKLKNEIGISEIEEAINIQNYYLRSLGIDPITKKIDISKAKGISDTADKRARDTLLLIINEAINDSLNLSLGINYIDKSELKERFINETGYGYETFKKRFRELVNNKDIIVKKNKEVYLNR